MDSNLPWEIRFRLEEEAKKLFKSQAEEYKNQVELLQQRVTELESQLSQTNDLKVQDLLSSLSVGDPDKQLLAQQISKYLEELEASEAETSDPAMSSASHHLVTAEGMVHSFKLEPPTTLAQELEAGNGDTDINSMSDSYQVISQVVDSHRVLINHTGEPTIHVKEVSAANLHSNLNDKCVGAAVESQSDPQQDMFTSVEEVPHSEELLVSEVLASSVDHVSEAQSLMESAGTLPREEHTVLNIGGTREEGLLQVVAAADGLASLGTDVTVVAAGDNSESTRTFIMEVEDGQQLLVQQGEEDGSLQPINEETISSESKRPRLS